MNMSEFILRVQFIDTSLKQLMFFLRSNQMNWKEHNTHQRRVQISSNTSGQKVAPISRLNKLQEPAVAWSRRRGFILHPEVVDYMWQRLSKSSNIVELRTENLIRFTFSTKDDLRSWISLSRSIIHPWDASLATISKRHLQFWDYSTMSCFNFPCN